MLLFSFTAALLSALWLKVKRRPLEEAEAAKLQSQEKTAQLTRELNSVKRSINEANLINKIDHSPFLENNVNEEISLLRQEIKSLEAEHQRYLGPYNEKKRKEREEKRRKEAAAAAALASARRRSSSYSSSYSSSSSSSWRGGGGGFSGGGSSGRW